MCPASRKNVVLTKDLFDPVLGVVVSKPRDSIVFNGLPQRLDAKNDYVFPVLEGSDTTLAKESDGTVVDDLVGRQLKFVSAFQVS